MKNSKKNNTFRISVSNVYWKNIVIIENTLFYYSCGLCNTCSNLPRFLLYTKEEPEGKICRL